MKDDSSKLRHQQHQHASSHKQAKGGPLEFATAEELLRHDVAKTAPPDSIIERLNRSLAAEPLEKRSWWQRLFSK